MLTQWLKDTPSPLPPNASHQVISGFLRLFGFPSFNPAAISAVAADAALTTLYAQVGIGAFVTNESGQVLMVQEGNGPLKGSGTWKMPTGLVAAGEDLHEAAPREVFEETVGPCDACMSHHYHGITMMLGEFPQRRRHCVELYVIPGIGDSLIPRAETAPANQLVPDQVLPHR